MNFLLWPKFLLQPGLRFGCPDVIRKRLTEKQCPPKHLELKMSPLSYKSLWFWTAAYIWNLVKTYRRIQNGAFRSSILYGVTRTLFLGLLVTFSSGHVAWVPHSAILLIPWNPPSWCCPGFRTPACVLHFVKRRTINNVLILLIRMGNTSKVWKYSLYSQRNWTW